MPLVLNNQTMRLVVAELSAHFGNEKLKDLHHKKAFTDPHPGDPFGTFLATLWKQGLKDEAAKFVAGYLAQIRVHGTPTPEPGNRITLTELINYLPLAINKSLIGISDDEIAQMSQYLDEVVPQLYSEDLDEIDRK